MMIFSLSDCSSMSSETANTKSITSPVRDFILSSSKARTRRRLKLTLPAMISATYWTKPTGPTRCKRITELNWTFDSKSHSVCSVECVISELLSLFRSLDTSVSVNFLHWAAFNTIKTMTSRRSLNTAYILYLLHNSTSRRASVVV